MSLTVSSPFLQTSDLAWGLGEAGNVAGSGLKPKNGFRQTDSVGNR